MYACTYYDLQAGKRSNDIGLLFPGWKAGDERLLVVSPHDDDAALGAGYAMLAAQQAGAEAWVMICCNGCAGYSTPEQKETIVEVRRAETIEAYARLGVPEDRIFRLDYPDLSLLPNIGLLLPNGRTGAHARSLHAMREIGVTRLLVPNGYREHIDHTAAFTLSSFEAMHVGDPVLADWGVRPAIRNTMVYSVWGDFSPEEAMVNGRDTRLRANRALVAPQEMETDVADSLRCFHSQAQIIEDLVAQRRGRFYDAGAVELYLAFELRPVLDYSPYHTRLREIG